MSYETIRLETDGRVARLTLDRPAVLNVRVSVHRDHSDRSIAITRIGRS